MNKKQRELLRSYYSNWADLQLKQTIYALLDHIDRLEAELQETVKEAQRDARNAYSEGLFDGQTERGGWEQ